MKRFKNMLFVADRHPVPVPALRRAIRLAGRNDARLTVLAIADPIEEIPLDAAPDSASLNKALRVGMLSGIEDALTGIDAGDREGVDIRVHAALGIGFVTAIRQVAAGGHDLLIKGADRPPGPIQRLFGSTDMHLLRKAPCPVWIEPEREATGHRRIVAAIDPVSDAHPGTDRTVLELATSLATIEEAELIVVHAWHLPGESMLRRGSSQITETEMRILLESTERRHREAVHLALEPFRDLPIRIHQVFVKGRPSEAIRETARSRGADLIVMGTVGRTGIPGFFIGNTAENVLIEAPCGVLTVKPEGFASPVLA